jgi:hypothetical protein
MALTFVSSASALAAAGPSPDIQITCDKSGDDSVLVISHPGRKKATPSMARGRSLVEFEKPISLPSPSALAPCAEMGFGVTGSLRSVSIAWPAGTTVQVDTLPDSLRLTAHKIEEDSGRSELDLALTRADVLFHTDGPAAALDALGPLSERYSTDTEFVRAYGSYQAAAGESVAATRSLSQWANETPDTASTDPLWLDLTSPYTNAALGSFELLDGGSAQKERRSRFLIRGRAGDAYPATMLEADARIDNADFHDIRSPSGAVVDRSVQLENYRLNARAPFAHGTNELGFAFSDYSFGGHFQLENEDSTGRTNARLQINEPNWEYASSVAFRGTKSTVSAARSANLLPSVRGSAGLGGNIFSLDGASDAAKSLSVDASLAYTLLPGATQIDLVYILDADYFADFEKVTGPDGERHKMFSAQSSEYHSLGLAAAWQVAPQSSTLRQTRLAGVAGYAFDRLGEPSPQLGCVLEGGWWKGPALRTELNRSFSNTGISDTQTRIYVELVWRL